MLLKPRFGSRMWSGIWPPSKPFTDTPERLFWPFWPRPAVLPRPEPMPRPTRTRSLRAPSAGLSVLRRMVLIPYSRRLRAFLDADQVADLIHETANLRRIRQLAHVVELAQAQRAHADAMTLLAAVDALVEAHADLAAGALRLRLSH